MQPAQTQQPGNQDEKMTQLKKAILAAQKIMYSPNTKKYFLQMLRGDDPVKMVSNAATQVVLLLINASKLQLDPRLVIPVGTVVIGDIFDFLEKARGVKATDEDLENAVEIFIKQIMSSIGGEKEVAQ